MINPMLRSQPTRLMGLSSGLDTDSIIQSALRMHQFKIDNQMRNRRLIEWRQQTHNNIKSEITNLRQTFLSNLGAKTMMNRNIYNATTATVTGKNAGAVSVRTLTGANPGTFRITEVVSLARGANITSTDRVSATGQGFSSNTRLENLQFAGGNSISWSSNRHATVGDTRILQADVEGATWSNASTTIDMAGNKITLTKDGGDIKYSVVNGDGIEVDAGTLVFDSEGKAEIAGLTGPGGGPFTITEESGQYKFGTSTLQFFETTTLTAENGTNIELRKREGADPLTSQFNGANLDFYGSADINIGGETITIRSNMTVNQMIAHVNKQLADAGTGLTMKYDGFADRFSIESANRDTAFTVGGQMLSVFGLNNANWDGGSQAEIKALINGNIETIKSDTNVFNMGDAIITVNYVTDPDDEPINIVLKRDAEKPLQAIKDFIDSYNAIIARLEGLLNERKTSNEVSYKPLTDEEKRGMTDKQIEEWEAIARKGIMRSDQGIQNLVFNLRRTFFDEIEGMGINPSQIGLTTGSYGSGTGGQIMIDEDRLRAALEDDPDKIADIFVKISSESGSPKGVGLLHKLDNLMMNFVNETQSTSIKSLEDSLKRANELIARMEQRMWAEEDRLYRQFAAMESAMSKLTQQGDWFNAMLGNSR